MDAAGKSGDPALIEFRGVTKVYGTGAAAVRALDGVDLAIEAGEMVAIMGPSGSGKSTALNMIGCLDTPTAGSYRFKGVDVGRLTRGQRALLRRHFIGFVFQGFNLLTRTTAVENVELPLIYRGLGFAERRALAMRALERVGLADRAHHAPGELSGGQQQTRRHRARHRHRSGRAPGRRADRQSRHQDQPRDHGPAVAAQPRAGHHLRHGDPRARHGRLRRASRSASSTAVSIRTGPSSGPSREAA